MCSGSRNVAYLLFLMVVAITAFFCIGTATVKWLHVENPFGKGWYGLNTICTDNGDGSMSCGVWTMGKCDPSPYEDNSGGGQTVYSTTPCNNFKSAQSLSMLACLLAGLALLIFICMLASSSVPTMVQTLAFLLILGAGIAGMIAMSTYTALGKTQQAFQSNLGGSAKYDFSYSLMIIGWITSYACFAFALITGTLTGSFKISGSS